MPRPVSLTVISTCESTRAQTELHLAAAGRELDRVRQQIPDDLLQPIRVARHRAVIGSMIVSTRTPLASAAGITVAHDSCRMAGSRPARH